jgi:histone-lysine N-methyltransferase SETMAR
LEQIGKVKKLDKWVPHNLTDKQINRRYEVCSSLIFRNNNEPFLDRIITCDEKWILYDNKRRTGQWLDENEAPKHFPKPNLHVKKVMVSVWWLSSGIIHYCFLESGKTITAESYSKQLDIVHQNLIQIKPALVNRKRPILLHDNARPHVGKVVLKKLNELGYEVLPHPPYSPDLAPTDYHLFKHLDNFLSGKIFNNQEAIENEFKEFINSALSSVDACAVLNLLIQVQILLMSKFSK